MKFKYKNFLMALTVSGALAVTGCSAANSAYRMSNRPVDTETAAAADRYAYDRNNAVNNSRSNTRNSADGGITRDDGYISRNGAAVNNAASARRAARNTAANAARTRRDSAIAAENNAARSNAARNNAARNYAANNNGIASDGNNSADIARNAAGTANNGTVRDITGTNRTIPHVNESYGRQGAANYSRNAANSLYDPQNMSLLGNEAAPVSYMENTGETAKNYDFDVTTEANKGYDGQRASHEKASAADEIMVNVVKDELYAAIDANEQFFASRTVNNTQNNSARSNSAVSARSVASGARSANTSSPAVYEVQRVGTYTPSADSVNKTDTGKTAAANYGYGYNNYSAKEFEAVPFVQKGVVPRSADSIRKAHEEAEGGQKTVSVKKDDSKPSNVRSITELMGRRGGKIVKSGDSSKVTASRSKHKQAKVFDNNNIGYYTNGLKIESAPTLASEEDIDANGDSNGGGVASAAVDYNNAHNATNPALNNAYNVVNPALNNANNAVNPALNNANNAANPALNNANNVVNPALNNVNGAIGSNVNPYNLNGVISGNESINNISLSETASETELKAQSPASTAAPANARTKTAAPANAKTRVADPNADIDANNETEGNINETGNENNNTEGNNNNNTGTTDINNDKNNLDADTMDIKNDKNNLDNFNDLKYDKNNLGNYSASVDETNDSNKTNETNETANETNETANETDSTNAQPSKK